MRTRTVRERAVSAAITAAVLGVAGLAGCAAATHRENAVTPEQYEALTVAIQEVSPAPLWSQYLFMSALQPSQNQ